MSGETLEDYFRRLSLDETQRKYLENIKEGKQVDGEIEERFKNVNARHHSLITQDRYSIYMKRFVIRHPNRSSLISYTSLRKNSTTSHNISYY